MKLGVVGLPNVGKSTLFNALTNAGAESANYPFCTIEPNVGIAIVKDKRVDDLTKLFNAKNTVYATCQFFDIAGLVAGASHGEGLGNKFLSHIRETNAILHCVRCFSDPDVIKVDGKIDPVNDAEIINLELILADAESVNKRFEKIGKLMRVGDKQNEIEYSALKKIKERLDNGEFASSAVLTKEEEEVSKDFFLITAKPMLYVANISEDDIKKNEDDIPGVKALKEYAKKQNAEVVCVSAKIESELNALEPEDAEMFMDELGIKERALDKLIKKSYNLLGLQSFLTAGEKEVRAWTIRIGAKAPEAAGTIHTDFERGFIKAEVVSFENLIENGSYAVCKEKGQLRMEGKDYVVKDGDVITFKFNV